MLGCVAGRTIEIDLESYELLTASKRFGESFSSLIKRMLQAERHAASHLLVHIGDVLLAEDTLAAVEAVADERSSS